MNKEEYQATLLSASLEAKKISAAVVAVMKQAESEGTEWRPSRADLHLLLDACYDLGEASSRNGLPELTRGFDATSRMGRSIAHALSVGVFGWTETPSPFGRDVLGDRSPSEAWQFLADRDPPTWRDVAIERLVRTPSVLPEAMLSQLVSALSALNAGTGELPPLLTPSPKEGRGQDPRMARKLEEQMWGWICYQVGLGRRMSDAIADVAAAVDRSDGAVKAWRDAWRRKDEDSFPLMPMETSLQNHKEAGEADAANPEAPRYEAAEMRELAKAWINATMPAKAVPES